MRTVGLWAVFVLATPIAAQPASRTPSHESVIIEQAYALGQTAGLDDLRTAPLGADDVELRLWYLPSFRTPTGFVLRRRSGEWSATGVAVERFTAAEPDSLARALGLLPYVIVEPMRTRCLIWERDEWDAEQRVGRTAALTCPYLVPRGRDPSTLEALWDNALADGLMTLTDEPAVIIGVDGDAYVVERRVGEAYAVFEVFGWPDSEARQTTLRLARRMGREAWPELEISANTVDDPYCLCEGREPDGSPSR